MVPTAAITVASRATPNPLPSWRWLLNSDEAWAVSAWETVANAAAWDDTMTWAMNSPMANIRARMNQRSVLNPTWVINPVERATPMRARATRRRGPNRG